MALPHVSLHAVSRGSRRNVPPDAVEYVLTYGRVVQRTGATFYFLGRRDLPYSDRRSDTIRRLVGTVVLVASNGTIITVYRNPEALHTIQRKTKYRLAMPSEDLMPYFYVEGYVEGTLQAAC